MGGRPRHSAPAVRRSAAAARRSRVAVARARSASAPCRLARVAAQATSSSAAQRVAPLGQQLGAAAVDLGQPEALALLARQCDGLAEHLQGRLHLSRTTEHVGQQVEEVAGAELGARRLPVDQTLSDLGRAAGHVALGRGRPTPHDRGPPEPEGEALVDGEGPDLVGSGPHGREVSLELPQPGVEREGQGQRERVAEARGPGDGVVAQGAGLPAAALEPERPGRVGLAGDGRVGDVVERRTPPSRRVVGGAGGHRVLEDPEGLGLVVPVVEERAPHGAAGRHRELRVLRARGQRDQAVRDIERDEVLGPHEVHPEDAVQRLEQLRHVAEAVTEGQRPTVDVLDLGRAVAPRRHQGRPEAHQQGQLLLVALAAVRQRGEQLQTGAQVGDGLPVGRAGQRPLAGQQPMRHRLLGHARPRRSGGRRPRAWPRGACGSARRAPRRWRGGGPGGRSSAASRRPRPARGRA